MQNTSPFLAMQRVEGQLRSLLRSIDIDTLDNDDKKSFATIRRLSADARLDIRDYELSETRAAQLKCAATAKRRLGKLHAAILGTGILFGPADIAQMSAQIEQIDTWLE